ncbi:MAG: ATP-binding protein [Methylococcus sp.]|nr:ATP-binding protein [Methylococcus sp.]
MAPTHPISWITLLWSMAASACLTLAGVYFIIWLKQRDRPAYLLFSLLALTMAAFAGFEYAMMHAESTRVFGELLYWIHIPVFAGTLAVIGFIQAQFGTGRAWLAYAACGLRGLADAVNFLSSPNLNYAEITALRHIPLSGGETIAVAEGIRGPWVAIDDWALLTTIVYLADAVISLWRRGGRDGRRRAALIGCSILCFILIAAGSAILIHAGILHIPYLISLPFLLVLLAMSYELSSDVLRAAQLSRQLKISESELRESQDRMRLAASAADLGLWLWDIARDEIWTMEQGRALYGIPKDERIDFARFMETLHTDDRETVRASVAKALYGGGDYEGEYRVGLPCAKARWVASRGKVEFDVSGKPIRMRGVSIDITRRKLAEQVVQQQRHELAHLSRVTLLGELSGSLAHELNQPLTAILANAQAAQRFLDQEPLDIGEVREILGDIVKEDKRAGEVIRRLRLLFRKGELQHGPIDVNALVEDVLKLLRSDLVSQSVGVVTTLAPALPMISGDRVQLQQVLLNLVMNACDAMACLDRTEREIRIVTETAAANGIRLTVADRGRGIPAEDLERVFEPFVTTKNHGLGLGLSVCRTIVSAHGGTIRAANNPERGVCFSLILPPLPEQTHVPA